MVLACIVKSCVRTKKTVDKMYRFPKDIALCNEWLTNCDRLDLLEKLVDAQKIIKVDALNKNYRVCGKHFSSRMFANPEKTILLPKAVPTVIDSNYNSIKQASVPEEVGFNKSTVLISDTFLEEPATSSTPRNSTPVMSETSVISISECSIASSSTSTQIIQKLSVNTPRKRNLRNQVRELEKKCKGLEEGLNANTKQIAEMIASVDHFNEVVDAHLPPNLSMLVKNYVNIVNKKPQGYRYSSQLKQLALSIYFFGPVGYRFLKSILLLPSPRTLRRITQKLEIDWIK